MPNTNKLPKDLQDKLIKWEQNKPEFRSAKMLEDIGLIVEDMSNTLAEQSKDGKAFSKDLGAILLDMRGSLEAFNAKDDITIPDYAKPVVEALNALQSEFAKSIDKIDMKPEFKPNIRVDSPKVDVSVPDIDLRGIEKVLKKDIPAAFDKAIKSMPTMEIPENDLSPLLDVLTEVSGKLDSIDTATRMKPQGPTNVSVAGVSTSANQTNGTQKTQLVDSTNTSLSAYGKVIVGNAKKKFRDGFSRMDITQPDSTVWDYVNDNTTATGHIVTQGGNTFSSGYLRISLSPFLQDSSVSITTKDTFSMPFRAGFGITTSQRILGQEVGLELVGVDANNAVKTITPIADVDMPASVTVATANTCPIVFATPHSFHGGDRVVLYGCYDSRVNAGPVIVTVVNATTISVPITLAVASYNTTGGKIRWADPLDYAENGTSLLLENATVTNGSFVTRRNGGSFRLLNSTIATTTATQAATSPYSDAFISAANQELYGSLEEIGMRSFGADGLATMSGIQKWTQGIPDEEVSYKIRIRAKNLKNLTVPVGRITTIAKTGSTTATVTTDVNHGLTVGDFVQIYGVLNQAATAFPNLTTAVVVGSTPTPTTFTCVIGTSSTTTSNGGVVYLVNGSATAPGALTTVAIQSISRSNNILTVIGSATWATPLPGEYMQLWGMTGAAAQYDGAYKVLRVSTSTLELESVGADFGSIATGGACFRRTDVRVHFTRLMDYTRLVTEIVGGRGNTSDINNSVPVSITGSATLPAVTTVTTVTNLTNIGTNPADMMARNISKNTWANLVRSTIT